MLARLLLLDGGVAVGVGRGDAGVLERLLDFRLAEGVEVTLVILDRLEHERPELEAHPLEVDMGLVADLLLETTLVAVQLLDGQGADDAAEVTGDGLLDGRLDVLYRHPEKALGRAADVVDVALHLDLGDGLDVDGDALDRVDVTQVDLQRHHPQRQDLVLLPRRPHEGAAAAHDPKPLDLAGFRPHLAAEQLAAAEHDQRLVGPRLLVAHPHHEVAEQH